MRIQSLFCCKAGPFVCLSSSCLLVDGEAGDGGDDDGGDDGGSSGWFGGWEEEPEDDDEGASAVTLFDSMWAWRCCLVLMVLQTVHFLALNPADAAAGQALGTCIASGSPGFSLATRPHFAALSAAFFAPRARQGGLRTLPPRT